MSNKPKAIIVTFPVQFLIDLGYYHYYKTHGYVIGSTKKEYTLWGFKECIRQIETIKHDPDMFWLHSMGNKPVYEKEILYCYVNILNKIRYKAKVIGFEPGGEKEFDDGRKRTAKHWLLLHEFEKVPEIRMGGFQGFRYWKYDY